LINFTKENIFFHVFINKEKIIIFVKNIVVVVVLPDPLTEEWGRKGTPRGPNSRPMPQGLDRRSKIEELVPKMALRRGSDAG